MALLEGRVVVVTGAASAGSIGEAIARQIVREGGTPIVTSRSATSAEEAASRLGGRARGAACDLTDAASVARFAADALAAHGRVDGIVHNAGAPVREWSRGFLDVPPEAFARVFDVDVVGAIRLTHRLLPAMLEAERGALVFTSSTAALAGYDAIHEFSPAKAAVLGLMRGLAAEYGRRNVRSNAVAYGNVATPPTLEALSPEAREALAEESPMRRWATPDDAAGASVFLLSDLASFVNGQVVVVDGGTVMR